MPRRAVYTREEIAQAAFELVRAQGEGALSARQLASRLGTSTAPVFTAFASIEEVHAEVARRAAARYTEYLQQGMSEPVPFKGAGRAYIRFAQQERELFRMLFMRARGDVTHYMPEGDSNEPAVRSLVESRYGLSTAAAKYVYNHLSVYVHGLATMFAQEQAVFTDEDVDRMLSEMFMALMKTAKDIADTQGELNQNAKND